MQHQQILNEIKTLALEEITEYSLILNSVLNKLLQLSAKFMPNYNKINIKLWFILNEEYTKIFSIIIFSIRNSVIL